METSTESGRWRRASACIPDNQCVEVRLDEENVDVRDTKQKNGPELRFCRPSWAAFVIHFDALS
jgi:hypothetical protein